ncbi:MAG: hypothetical protein RLZZ419_1122 [Pseudomonadota bacterium]|jgi:hypothetical protein
MPPIRRRTARRSDPIRSENATAFLLIPSLGVVQLQIEMPAARAMNIAVKRLLKMGGLPSDATQLLL